LRNALPKREKARASRIVLLPDPFLPTMSVVLSEFRETEVKVFPVERKFFHLIASKIIMVLSP